MSGEDETYSIPRTLVLCQWCELSGPSICFCTQSVPHHHCSMFDDDETDNSSSYSVRGCEKDIKDVDECCRIIPGNMKYVVSHEMKNHRTYISTSTPPLKDYSLVREALIRANNEHFAASDIVLLSNNKGYTKSTVVTRFFKIKDTESRGQVRKCLLMMVLSERFAAIDYIPDLHEKFGEIIKILVDKSEASFEIDMNERKFKSLPERRAPSKVLKFDNLHNFLHERFSQLHYLLETKHLPLIIVPPGKIDEINQMKPTPCYCNPPQADSTSSGRDRAQTLVELPAPRFNAVDEIADLLGTTHFKELVTHIVTGDQIVVRGEAALTVESILNLLATFLPANCVSNAGFVNKYQSNYCKLIGLPLSVYVPDSSDVLVIDVRAAQENPREYKHFKLSLRNLADRNSAGTPTIVDEIINLVSLSRNQTHETYKKSLVATLSRWSGKAMNYWLYMKSMSNSEGEENAILEIFQVRRKDIPVLKFFVNAIKKGERTRLLKEVQ